MCSFILKDEAFIIGGDGSEEKDPTRSLRNFRLNRRDNISEWKLEQLANLNFHAESPMVISF